MNLDGYDMLNLTLTNPKRWGLKEEIYGILTILEENLRSIGLTRGMERSVHSAWYIFAETLRRMGQMSDVEYVVNNPWCHLFNNEFMKSPSGLDLSADLIIYLQTEPKNA